MLPVLVVSRTSTSSTDASHSISSSSIVVVIVVLEVEIVFLYSCSNVEISFGNPQSITIKTETGVLISVGNPGHFCS